MAHSGVEYSKVPHKYPHKGKLLHYLLLSVCCWFSQPSICCIKTGFKHIYMLLMTKANISYFLSHYCPLKHSGCLPLNEFFYPKCCWNEELSWIALICVSHPVLSFPVYCNVQKSYFKLSPHRARLWVYKCGACTPPITRIRPLPLTCKICSER